MSFTPGPWLSDDYGCIWHEGDRDLEIAYVEHDRQEWEDNSRLMAAAPEMAELLGQLQEYAADAVDNCSRCYSPELDALAQATCQVLKRVWGEP